jgi:CDP-4-dehydro-6-deoxyglucose reductase/3-phenylpropionate/trans-cinnamate dioxygenase ferredoxin reductase subunit
MRRYWGARRNEDLYLGDLPVRWIDKAPGLAFIPVLSEPSGSWTGRTGLVHRAVIEDHDDLSAIEVYSCGNPLMISAVQDEFVNVYRLPPHRLYSYAFAESGLPSANQAVSAA